MRMPWKASGKGVSAVLLLASLYVIYLKPKGIAEDIPIEGSSEAIEARLARLGDTSP